MRDGFLPRDMLPSFLPKDISAEICNILDLWLPESVKRTILEINLECIDAEIQVAREHGLRWNDSEEDWEVIEHDERVKIARVRRDAQMRDAIEPWLSRQPWAN